MDEVKRLKAQLDAKDLEISKLTYQLMYGYVGDGVVSRKAYDLAISQTKLVSLQNKKLRARLDKLTRRSLS